MTSQSDKYYPHSYSVNVNPDKTSEVERGIYSAKLHRGQWFTSIFLAARQCQQPARSYRGHFCSWGLLHEPQPHVMNFQQPSLKTWKKCLRKLKKFTVDGERQKVSTLREGRLSKKKNTQFRKYVCCKLEKQTGLIKNEYLNIQMNETENIFSLLFSSALAMAHQHFLRPPILAKAGEKERTEK